MMTDEIPFTDMLDDKVDVTDYNALLTKHTRALWENQRLRDALDRIADDGYIVNPRLYARHFLNSLR